MFSKVGNYFGKFRKLSRFAIAFQDDIDDNSTMTLTTTTQPKERMMSKTQMIDVAAKLMAPNDVQEQKRLKEYLATRTLGQVTETLARQQAIAGTTKREMRLHCQVTGLPRIGR